MITILIGFIAALICLVVLFATGKKTPSRTAGELPTPSLAVRVLINDKKIMDAIKLYRHETGASLHEAKIIIYSVRS